MSDEEQPVPIVYVALGDSTGVGVGARKGGGYAARLLERLNGVRRDSRLVNLCISGATTADLLRWQVGRVRDAKPTLVTLGIGINDITHGLTPDEFERNYEEIIERIRAATDAPVVVTNVPDISTAPAVPVFMREGVRERINLFNARVAEVAARHRLSLVDAYTKSHAVIPTHPEFFSPDR